MAVNVDPAGEAGQGERLISSGGNIYSMSTGPTKVGIATRGRGFWAGRKRHDEDDPDVDDPKLYPADEYVPVPDKNDGFDDDLDPMLAMNVGISGIKNATRAQMKQAKEIVEAAMGVPTHKALTFKDVHVDLLLTDPMKLDEAELIKSASTVKFLIDAASSDSERMMLSEYAGRLAQAIRKALPKKEVDVNKKDSKPVKMPPKKSQETKADARGKTQYKYSKKGDGKGPNSDGRKPKQQKPEQEDPMAGQDASQVTPPQPIDPTPFAKLIGVGPGQLERFAAKKTRQEFTDFFIRQKDLVEKHGISAAFLGQLYATLTTPQQPQQVQQQSPVPPPGQPGKPPTKQAPAAPLPAVKSMVIFNGATLNRQTRMMIDILKSHKAETIDDIQKCLQAHYACSAEQSADTTRTLLRQWEREGLVQFAQPKEQ
jgi:hypothetical protein